MPTTLSTDEMKARVRSHFEDFVNNRKAEVIRTNMTPDFYDHDGPGGEPTDASGDEEMMRQMYTMMPDLHLTIEDLIAEDDKVVCKNSWRWTDAQTDFRPGACGMPLCVCQTFLDHVKHRRFQLLRKLGVSVRQFCLYLHATSLRKTLSVNAQCRE